MIIQEIVAGDLPRIVEFQLDKWPDIRPDFRFYIQNPFTHPIKILHQDQMVGVGCAISLKKTAWLGHVIVKEKYRNQGIGTIIVDYLCDYLKRKGAETISLITTPGGYPFYRKLGFKVETEYIFLDQNRSISGSISPKISQLQKEDLPPVLTLDKKVSGEDRSIILKDRLTDAYLYQDEDNIQGYYLPHLGEGLVIAQELRAGLELLKLRSLNKDQIVLPVDNSTTVNFLLDNGSREIRRVKRMVIGERFTWDPSRIFNRIAGNLG